MVVEGSDSSDISCSAKHAPATTVHEDSINALPNGLMYFEGYLLIFQVPIMSALPTDGRDVYFSSLAINLLA